MIHDFGPGEANASSHVLCDSNVNCGLPAHPAAEESRRDLDRSLRPSSGYTHAPQAPMISPSHEISRTDDLVRLFKQQPVGADSLIPVMLYSHRLPHYQTERQGHKDGTRQKDNVSPPNQSEQ